MSILVKRSQLWFVWLLTRHPRFKPLYHRDVVTNDVMEQAEFLAHAGFYVAAAMMARLAVESRIKRLAVMTPEWGEYRHADSMASMAHKLRCHGRIGARTERKVASVYQRASRVAHGTEVDAEQCRDIIGTSAMLVRKLDCIINGYLKEGIAAAAA